MHPGMTRDSRIQGRALLGVGALIFTAGCAQSSVIGVTPGEGSGGKGGIKFDPGACAVGQIVCEKNLAKTCDGLGGVLEEVNCADSGKECAAGYGCVACVPYSPAGC